MSQQKHGLLKSLLKLSEPIQIYTEHDISEAFSHLATELDDRLNLLDLLLKDFFKEYCKNDYDSKSVLELTSKIDQILRSQCDLLITTIEQKIPEMLSNLAVIPKETDSDDASSMHSH